MERRYDNSSSKTQRGGEMRLLKVMCIMTLVFTYLGDFLVSEGSEETFRRIRLVAGLVFDKYSISYRGENTKFLSPFPTLKIGEEFFEDRLSGQKLANEFEKFVNGKLGNEATKYLSDISQSLKELQNILGKSHSGLTSEELEQLDKLVVEINKFITKKAKEGDPTAKEFLRNVGIEFGRALGYYLVNIRNILITKVKEEGKANQVISNIVLVGGVSEHLGRGVTDSDGNDLLLESIKSGVKEVLKRENILSPIISNILNGIVRSNIGGERDFYGYPAEGKDKVNVVIRAGGTSFGMGIIDRNSNILHTEDETWREYLTIKRLTSEIKKR